MISEKANFLTAKIKYKIEFIIKLLGLVCGMVNKDTGKDASVPYEY